jgi:hypothetical protein
MAANSRAELPKLQRALLLRHHSLPMCQAASVHHLAAIRQVLPPSPPTGPDRSEIRTASLGGCLVADSICPRIAVCRDSPVLRESQGTSAGSDTHELSPHTSRSRHGRTLDRVVLLCGRAQAAEGFHPRRAVQHGRPSRRRPKMGRTTTMAKAPWNSCCATRPRRRGSSTSRTPRAAGRCGRMCGCVTSRRTAP